MTHPKSCSDIMVPASHQRRRLRSRNWPRPPRRDPHTRLIAQLMDLAGADVSVLATSSVPWASATFIGRRHKVVLRLHGAGHEDRANRLIALLPDAEFSISGHLVADACVDARTLHHQGANVLAEEAGSGASATASAPLSAPMDRECVDTETVLKLSFLTIEDW